MVTCKRKETMEMVTQFEHTNNHAGTQLKSDLLYFWSRYPNAKFTLGVIAGALDRARKVDVEEALDALVTAEITEKHTQRGLPFYCLTTDPEKREPILRLSAHNGYNGHNGGFLQSSVHAGRQRAAQLMF